MQYSVVNYKTVRENSDFRIDAEYYRQYFFDLLSKISQKKNFALSEISSNKTKRFKGDYDFEYLEISNISTADASCIYQFLSKEETPSRAQKILKNKDVVISTVRPNRNAVSFINEIEGLKVASSGFCVLRNFRNVLPEYIFILFKTYIFRDLLDRETKATMYPAVSEEDILNLRIPIFSLNFQKKIAGIVLELFKKQNQSKSLYSQAEQLLLSELGLLGWKPKHTLAFVKNYSDTQKAERIDAEYFQPFYDEIENQLSKFEQTRLDNICDLINYGTVPTSPYVEKGKAYIKGLNLVDGFIVGPFDYLENTENLSEKFYTKENDIIISQMGTVGKAGLVSKEEEGFLFASFTIRARLKNDDFIKPHVLTMFINTIARPYYLLRKIAQASVRQNTDLPTIKALKVPKLDKRLQENIQKKVIKSQKAKKLSKSLLEIAKRGVEIAIEKDEQEAEEWIESEIEKLGVRIQ